MVKVPLRVRVVLMAAVLLAGGALLLEMSGSAPRGAGSDHASPAIFAATVPGGGVLCQPSPFLPEDAARAQILIGTFGHPVPALRLSFLDAGGAEVAGGSLPAGAHEGTVTIPVAGSRGAGAPSIPRGAGAPLIPRGAGAPSRVCLHVGGSFAVALGGEGGPLNPSSELVDGRPQPGRISLLYMRSGSESWWQLLPALGERFGLGKASFFGDWTLPLLAALLLGVWVAGIRLLGRELR